MRVTSGLNGMVFFRSFRYVAMPAMLPNLPLWLSAAGEGGMPALLRGVRRKPRRRKACIHLGSAHFISPVLVTRDHLFRLELRNPNGISTAAASPLQSRILITRIVVARCRMTAQVA